MIFDLCLLAIKCMVLYRVFLTLGMILWTVVVYRIIPRFWKPNFDRFKYRWTVVNGCTDGIGKAYTLELAKYGMRRFVLIGRNKAKLLELSAFLACHPKIETRIFVFDYLSDDPENLKQFLQVFDIGFVVNCIGSANNVMRRLTEQEQMNRDVFKINLMGTLETLHAVIPPMLAHGGGQIVIVSSCSGYLPMPKNSCYAASKAAVTFLSESVGPEYDTINIQCLNPCMVATKLLPQYPHKEDGWFVKIPSVYASEAVKTIGLCNECTGCFSHELQMITRYAMPEMIFKRFSKLIYNMQDRLLERVAERNRNKKAE